MTPLLRTLLSVAQGATLLVVPATACLACQGSEGLVLATRPAALGGTSGQGGEAATGGSSMAATGGVGGEGGVDEFWLSACRPEVTFENLDTSESGMAVEAALGDPTEFVHAAAANVCRHLYREESEVPDVPLVVLKLEPSDGPGSIGGNEVTLGSTHLAGFDEASGALYEEAFGMSHFLLAHMYQHVPDGAPGWIISGKADFVRLRSGLVDPSDRSPGGGWTDGFQTTAFFLDWLTSSDADFVYELNQRMDPGGPGYTDEIFLDLTGTELPLLWDEYQTAIQ